MLESVKITRRQSEIRQALSGLVGKAEPSDDDTTQMERLDSEYRTNETRYRAALIAEDQERREAKGELETRGDREYAELVSKFELRQVALHLDEGRPLDGPTAEVVTELRSGGGYRGIPVPWQTLEKRAGETVAGGTPNPMQTMPIIDRIFADSAAVRMGASLINIVNGEVDYPVTTSSVSAGWAATETGSVAGPTVYATTDRPLAPDHTLGIQMKITRKALKQSGDALEQAVRRDINGAVGQALDTAVFRGSGSGGEPTGIIAGAAGFGITSTAIHAQASWAAFRAAVTRFMTATAVSEWDRLTKNIPAPVLSANALAMPITDGSNAVLTAVVNGVPPIFVGLWGAIDLIRDPYSDAASGGLRLTALATADVTVSRAVQLEVLTGILG